KRSRGEANGIVHVEQVGEADVALRGGIELSDLLNAEALLEGLPDGWAQAVANHLLQGMVAVVGSGRLVQEIAAQLTDVTKAGGIVLAHVIPELTGGKLASHRDGRAARHGRTPAHDQGCGMVKGQ